MEFPQHKGAKPLCKVVKDLGLHPKSMNHPYPSIKHPDGELTRRRSKCPAIERDNDVIYQLALSRPD